MIIKSEQEMIEFGENLGEQVSLDGSCRRSFPHRARLSAARGGGPPSSATRRCNLPSCVTHQCNPSPDNATVIELVGDVGAGKTTFVRGLAKGLGVKEPVTSPSFTISKSYALPGGGNLVHYDFYRLSDPGLMVEDFAENINNPKNIVVVEWGESVKDLLPESHVTIVIRYNDDNTREVEIK